MVWKPRGRVSDVWIQSSLYRNSNVCHEAHSSCEGCARIGCPTLMCLHRHKCREDVEEESRHPDVRLGLADILLYTINLSILKRLQHDESKLLLTYMFSVKSQRLGHFL